ncbi:hypothetical protein, partial [Vibrio sp. 10N.222.54.C2]|uniref:hypothetical protein n=2 Tax=unclassified Vibrio TaxID=2614977 RepID=UPI003552FEAE
YLEKHRLWKLCPYFQKEGDSALILLEQSKLVYERVAKNRKIKVGCRFVTELHRARCSEWLTTNLTGCAKLG